MTAHSGGVLTVARPGVGPPRADTPTPAGCENCGCELSKYRADAETSCWSCRHGGPSIDERERRILQLSLGTQPVIVPRAEFICPECRGVKSEGAKCCARCRFSAPHPKKPPLGVLLKTGPCPVCGGAKSAKARICRDCWILDQRLLFAGNPAVTCPDCGGPKVRKAARCRKCRDRIAFGTIYVGERPFGLICPDCGGVKKLKRAMRCRTCAVLHRRGAMVDDGRPVPR
jgi:hypothetical protein